MSIFAPRSIACPHCQAREQRLVALSINASRRPDVRDAIVDDRFQRFDCAACGRRFVVDGPLFYLDIERRQSIGVYPARWERSWRVLEAEVERSHRQGAVEFAPPIIRAIAGELTVRLVFGLAALRDKLVCLEAELDDAALEATKLRLMQTAPLRLSPAARPSLERADVALRFVVVDGDTVTRFDTERGLVAQLAGNPAWQPARAAVAGGAYVDVGRILIPGNEPRPEPLRHGAPRSA